jgi:hypothetical protein
MDTWSLLWVAVLVCTGSWFVKAKLLPGEARPKPLGPEASLGDPQLRASQAVVVMKEVEKHPFVPVAAEGTAYGGNNPVTVKLQVRVKVLLAQRFPAAAASRPASRHTLLPRASDTLRRLFICLNG